MAVFDVVKSTRRPSPFALLQPRLRLQDIFPSAARQRDYSNDETAFVGLVPGTGSFFALSPDHFPLVAFSEPAPIQRVEGVNGVVSDVNGVPQCFEGTTDRRCLTGVRTLRADSRSRLARLLDGVPGPATSSLPSAVGNPARSGNANLQASVESDQLPALGDGKTPAVPWEWVNSVPESLAQRRSSWAPSSSALLMTLVTVVATLLWYRRKVSLKAHDTSIHMSAGSIPDELVHKTAAARNPISIPPLELADGAAHTTPLDSQAVETRPGLNATLLENSPLAPIEFPPTTPESPPGIRPDTPMPSSAASVSAKFSPVTESLEGVEDEVEVKKKPRKRRRRRKGDAKDSAAEGGEEIENEDGEAREGGEDGNADSPGILSQVPPPTPASPASSSLVVSDTILGMFFLNLCPISSS